MDRKKNKFRPYRQMHSKIPELDSHHIIKPHISNNHFAIQYYIINWFLSIYLYIQFLNVLQDQHNLQVISDLLIYLLKPNNKNILAKFHRFTIRKIIYHNCQFLLVARYYYYQLPIQKVKIPRFYTILLLY